MFSECEFLLKFSLSLVKCQYSIYTQSYILLLFKVRETINNEKKAIITLLLSPRNLLGSGQCLIFQILSGQDVHKNYYYFIRILGKGVGGGSS